MVARLGTLLVMLVSCDASLMAQAQDYETSRIAAIRFFPEKQPFSQSYLEKVVRLEPGEMVRLSEVSAAIQRLYETGRFIDVEVDAQRTADGVVLEFREPEQLGIKAPRAVEIVRREVEMLGE